MVRLEHRGVKVGDGRARGRDDEHGAGCFDRNAEREKSADALIDAHAQSHEARALELGSGERERLRPRPRTEHDVSNPELNELLQQCHRKRGGG